MVTSASAIADSGSEIAVSSSGIVDSRRRIVVSSNGIVTSRSAIADSGSAIVDSGSAMAGARDYFFVVGCLRSGTTLLSVLLDRYTRLWTFTRREATQARCGEKTPTHLTHVPAILRLFPHARVICMLRDGRDT